MSSWLEYGERIPNEGSAVNHNLLKPTKEKTVLWDNQRDPHKPFESDVFGHNIAIFFISDPMTNLHLKDQLLQHTTFFSWKHHQINKPTIKCAKSLDGDGGDLLHNLNGKIAGSFVQAIES